MEQVLLKYTLLTKEDRTARFTPKSGSAITPKRNPTVLCRTLRLRLQTLKPQPFEC